MTEGNSNRQNKQSIAVIGGGVAGLSAAWHLAVNTGHEVHLFEAEPRLGGHAYTTTVNVVEPNTTGGVVVEQKIDVDVGFMVFNQGNYPNMVQWFQALGVASEQSDMSLSVSLDRGKVEWNSDGLNGAFANRSQLFSMDFYTCIADMVRFHSQAAQLLQLHQDDPRKHVTIQQYLSNHNYSHAFCTMYLYPVMAALWSASMDDVANFPAAQLIGFLCNHQMLQLLGRPQWMTPSGRSQTYTQRVLEVLQSECDNVHVHVSSPVHAVENTNGENSDTDDGDADDDEGSKNNNNGSRYNIYVLEPENVNDSISSSHSRTSKLIATVDQVVFACHPPTAKAILENGDRLQHSTLLDLLGKIKYADNVVYVHSDAHLMPVRSRAWASWNCLGRSQHLLAYTSSKRERKCKASESFEGGASGFGATTANKKKPEKHVHYADDDNVDSSEHGGRMKAVYVTYWLNRLQNLTCETDIFVSLNPHTPPAKHLIYEKLIMAHPQCTPQTLQARKALLSTTHQGSHGLWFCGAWAGFGFHEDGCRSGFEVATQLSGVPLPWCNTSDKNNNDDNLEMVLPPPDLSQSKIQPSWIFGRAWHALCQAISYDLPVAICKRFICYFLRHAIHSGTLSLKFNDGSMASFGDGKPCSCGDNEPVVLRVFDDWFFVKTALEYDLGLARSYMAGHFVVEPLEDKTKYHTVLRPADAKDETTVSLGDPLGLTRLFLLLIGNRDYNKHHEHEMHRHEPRKAGQGHFYSNALTNASGLVISKIGSLLNYCRYKMTMDNCEKGGSLKNIHAHYDLSNDIFKSFLDKETLMYSSAIYDAVQAPRPQGGLVFRGTLEEAQWRKLDTLLQRAQIQPNQTLLDIGFGWGGLSIHAAKRYNCQVTGITLSVEQKALAEERVRAEALEHLITFEVVDYRAFCRRKENCGKFDRVLSCEMIEAVGHKHLGAFFWAVEQVLAHDGILVMEAITTPEERYETYRRSADFINTIIFPGSCCPSLHALMDAAYHNSCLTLEHIDNIGLHYAQTLAEWRRRFNANESFVRSLGFDDIFLRAWNYYLTYCEAGFFSQTENCLILVFARQGCSALAPLCETRSVTQPIPFTDAEINNWIGERSSGGNASSPGADVTGAASF